MANIIQLRRRALIMDGVALVLGLIILFLGSKELAPMWLLATGTVIAFVLLVFSVIDLLRVRRLEREMLQEYISRERQQRRQGKDVESAPSEDGDNTIEP